MWDWPSILSPFMAGFINTPGPPPRTLPSQRPPSEGFYPLPAHGCGTVWVLGQWRIWLHDLQYLSTLKNNNDNLVGGFSQLGLLFPIYGNIKKMVQTTNQMMLICLKDWSASCHIGTCSFSASYSWKPKDFDGKSVGSDVCPAPLSSCMMVGLTKAMESGAYIIHPISIRIPSDLLLHPISIPNYVLGFSAGKLPLNINLQHVNTILANPLFFTTRHDFRGINPRPIPFEIRAFQRLVPSRAHSR